MKYKMSQLLGYDGLLAEKTMMIFLNLTESSHASFQKNISTEHLCMAIDLVFSCLIVIFLILHDLCALVCSLRLTKCGFR